MKHLLLLFFIVFSSLVFSSSALRASPIQVIQTALNTPNRLSPVSPITWNLGPPPPPQHSTVQIVRQNARQTIFGFGGAFTEAGASTFATLSPQNQKKILSLYWGPSSNHYTVGRVHMGSCDFSIASYNFDNVSEDFQLRNFNISHDKIWLLPFIKAAISVSIDPIRLFLTPWSPPGWMKNNHHMDGSDNPCLIVTPNYLYQATWANYFSKFITAYKNEGVDFWGLTIQNEPRNDASWEACVYTPEAERDFLKNQLGPVLQRDHPQIQIMIYDHNEDQLQNWVETILSDPAAASYVSGTAFHWYSGANATALDVSHSFNPNKFLLATEACNCPPDPNYVNGSWNYAEYYAYNIMVDLNHWSVGFTDWNMLLDLQGGPNHVNNFCDSPVRVDTQKDVVYIQPAYYYIGQFTRYILPKTVIVETNVKTANGVNPGNFMAVSGVRPDGSVVVVIMNSSGNEVLYRLIDGEYWVSTSIPAHSIITLIYTL